MFYSNYPNVHFLPVIQLKLFFWLVSINIISNGVTVANWLYSTIVNSLDALSSFSFLDSDYLSYGL